MNDETFTVELTKEELQATGLAVLLWRSEVEGLHVAQAAVLIHAVNHLDMEVFMAVLDRAIVKFAEGEDNWEGDPVLGTIQEQQDARVRVTAKLDQTFARFAQEGRGMWKEGDDVPE